LMTLEKWNRESNKMNIQKSKQYKKVIDDHSEIKALQEYIEKKLMIEHYEAAIWARDRIIFLKGRLKQKEIDLETFLFKISGRQFKVK
jgi:protein-arginine kinase activator protein McsA